MSTIGYVIIYTPQTGASAEIDPPILYDRWGDAETVAETLRSESRQIRRTDHYEVCSVESTS